jgi:hypothetical protein
MFPLVNVNTDIRTAVLEAVRMSGLLIEKIL